ncbi:hypothetical protein SNE40_004052 [Patella caerulea]|uniref:IGFBP N-terminal domain-containing protein n=1 Tax=Patella caerulea TaxID=87958 RepID=A0AAN8K457_PATCE
MKLLVVVCALVAVTLVGRSEGYACIPCSEVTCDELPTDCERVSDVCGCCQLCATKEGESCGMYSPSCESGTTCLYPELPAGEDAVQYMYSYWGTCISSKK